MRLKSKESGEEDLATQTPDKGACLTSDDKASVLMLDIGFRVQGLGLLLLLPGLNHMEPLYSLQITPVMFFSF